MYCMYISDEYSSIAIREAIGRLFLDPDFVGRLCFILGSSSNGDVLDSLSRHEDDICCSICFGSNLDFPIQVPPLPPRSRLRAARAGRGVRGQRVRRRGLHVRVRGGHAGVRGKVARLFQGCNSIDMWN